MWMRLLTAAEERDGCSGGKKRLFWSSDVRVGGGYGPISVEGDVAGGFAVGPMIEDF